MASAPYSDHPEELLSHADFVRGLARSLIRDDSRAEDVAQETWLAALNMPERAEKLRAWLAGTVRNLALKNRRTERRVLRREQGAARPETVRSAEELVMREAARKRVVEAVCALDEPYRSAILFRYYDDMPPRTIARQLDISVETVKTRIQRGLARVRRSLDASFSGSRKAWCQALAPIAGIELAALTAGGGASVLTGVLAMSLKIKIALAAVLFLVLTATFFTLFDTDGTDREGERPDLLAGPTGQARDEAASKDVENVPAPDRELLPPRESTETAAMPESFRKAMGAFKGRVVESDGTPVPRISVEMLGVHFHDLIRDVSTFLSDNPLDVTLKQGETATAEDGTFLLEGVYPRASYVLLVDRGGARPFTRVIDRLPGPGETVDLGDIELQPHAVLLGNVTDGEGNPVAGARVRATNLPSFVLLSGIQDYREGCSILVTGKALGKGVIDPPPAFDRIFSELPIATTFSRSDGSFRLVGVPLGSVNVVVDLEKHATTQRGPIALRESCEKDLGEIELLEGMTVRGVAVDQKGNPMPGVEVRIGNIYLIKEAAVLQPPIFTDEKGSFALPGFGTNTAVAAARRHPQDSWTVVKPFYPAGGSVLFNMPAGFDLTVKVAAEDGSPVANAALRLQNCDLPSDMRFYNPPESPGERVEFTEPGVVVVEDLTPGKYQFTITASGFATVRKNLEIKSEPVSRDVVLKPAHSIRVKVLDKETENPVEWAEVYTAVEENDWILNPYRVSRCRTDASGRASLGHLRSGKHRVTVSHPGYSVLSGQIEVPSDDEALFHLERGGTLEGIVHSGTTARQGPYMIILQMHWWNDCPETDLPRYSVTDAEGRFRVDNLTPGTWFVEVGPRLFDNGVAGVIEAVMDLPTLGQGEVKVVSGETTHLEIRLGEKEVEATSSVSGRVLVDGKPPAGVALSLNAEEFFQAELDHEGCYDLSPIPAGEYGMELSWSCGKKQRFEIYRGVDVEANAILDESFDIRTGSLSGRVVANERGDPLDKRCLLTIRTDGSTARDRVSIEIESQADGTFHVDGIPAGKYKIHSADYKVYYRPVKGVEVVPNKTAGPVIVVQALYDLVAGKVVLTDEMEEAFLLFLQFVAADDLDGGGVGVRISKETGAFETRRLKPGSYLVYLSVNWEGGSKPFHVEIPPGGITGLELNPEKGD